MSGKRSKARQSQTQVPQPSDYDSDIIHFSDVPPPPSNRTNAELNLSVIQRHNPDVVSILSIAPFSVVYAFSHTTQHWEKRDIEGTMFVCCLAPSSDGADRYAVMVLNRRGLANFTAELLNEDDVEITEQYVILVLRGDDELPQIVGLWIFEDTPTTRTINAEIIQDCAREAQTSRNLVEQQRQQQHKEANGQTQEEQNDEVLDAPQSEAMGRQLSLRELLGRQREQDDDWSVHNHHSPPARPAQLSHPQFAPSADTDFFRNAQRNAPLRQQQQQPLHSMARTVKGASQPKVLLDLFRNAKVGQQ